MEATYPLTSHGPGVESAAGSVAGGVSVLDFSLEALLFAQPANAKHAIRAPAKTRAISFFMGDTPFFLSIRFDSTRLYVKPELTRLLVILSEAKDLMQERYGCMRSFASPFGRPLGRLTPTRSH